MIEINDKLVVHPIDDFPIKTFNRNEVVRLLFREEQKIKETFLKDEYLVLDTDNLEIIGIKSTTKIGDFPIGDVPILNYVLNNDDKYKNSQKYNLGNANTLFDEIKRIY